MTSSIELPSLDSLITSVGAAGRRLSELDACEGGAGNLSLFVAAFSGSAEQFCVEEPMLLPLAVPELSDGAFLVTGSGCRLRDVAVDPEANLALLRVEPGGTKARVFSSPRRRFTRPTSEFNSHLGVHRDAVVAGGARLHAVVHAQPRRITFLSHHPKYATEAVLIRQLFRWQPETIVCLPEGIGLVPFAVPGSAELMNMTLESLRHHRLVIWQKHGLMARSEQSMMHAVDLIEYIETAATYEFMDLQTGGQVPGLSREQLREICEAWKVPERIL